jgi:uncharacterized protein (TIGR03066 family)
MKKSIFNLLTCLCVSILCCAFASCSSSNDEPEKAPTSIVGTWGYDNGVGNEELTFKSDGTFIDLVPTSYPGDVIRLKGNYSIDGEYLTLTITQAEEYNTKHKAWEDMEDFEIIGSNKFKFSVSGNSLTIKNLNSGESVVYTKK